MSPSREDEYAEAFRRGYEQARQGAEPTVRLDQGASAPPPWRDEASAGDHGEPTQQIERPGGLEGLMGGSAWDSDDDLRGGEHREPPPKYDEYDDYDDERRGKSLAPVALGVAALLLVGAAFGVGRLFADNAAQDTTNESATADQGTGSGGNGGDEAPEEAAYSGPVDTVDVARSSASCQSADSVDAAGNPISYPSSNAHDSDLTTAWRCDGSGAGQEFTVVLPEDMTVAEVGLVPGYAKTDPASGVDRYAENNRITRLRWRFDDGTTFVQKLDGNPADRSMRTMRVPETETGTIVIEILDSQKGPRNTVAISELRIGTPTS